MHTGFHRFTEIGGSLEKIIASQLLKKGGLLIVNILWLVTLEGILQYAYRLDKNLIPY